MKIRILYLLVFLSYLLPAGTSAQRLWQLELTPTQLAAVGGDTSVSHLKSLMELGDVSDWYSPATVLAFYHGADERDFILRKLSPMMERSNSAFTWFSYFQYQELRGFLGDAAAIPSLDTVIVRTETDQTRLQAIRLLAEVGHLDYFDILRDAIGNKELRSVTLQCLSLYGKDDRFRAEARTMLEMVATDMSATYPEVAAAVFAMKQIDAVRSQRLTEDVFHSSSGKKRLFLFRDLGLMDPDGQAERTVWAILRENDEFARYSYFPPSLGILEGRKSRRYFEPFFIKFTKDLLEQETRSSLLATSARQLLADFRPLQPVPGVSTVSLLDSMVFLQLEVSKYGWLADRSFVEELGGELTRARQALSTGDSVGCARAVTIYQNKVDAVYRDSLNPDPRSVTIEGWKFLYYNAQYILDRLPAIPPSPVVTSLNPPTAYAGGTGFSLSVKGKAFVPASAVLWNGSSHTTSFVADSVLQATILASDVASPGTASVAVVNPGNDTSNVMSFTIAQPPSGLTVKLVNSTGDNLTGGSLQYYDGSWKDAVNNNDGTFKVNTNLKSVSLRMTYEGGSQTKSNVTVGVDTVVFQTVNTLVKLQNSVGSPIDTGTVQYYFSAWKDFGVTTNGIAAKELLPGSYTFRMTYAAATNDKQQDIGTNPTVVFTTVNAVVQLKNSQGSFIDQGTVQYYFSSWQNLGTTTNGVATKELLPGNYTFRMAYASATNDKQQNIATNPTVVFNTVNATVQLKNSQGSLIDQGSVQYYFSSWQNLGTTTNGAATKELLPGNYTFRMTYASATNDKQQNIGTNATVVFQTVNTAVQLQNSQGALIDTGTVQYYFSSWQNFGTTTNGVVTKELLPANYTFRMSYASATKDKQQNVGTNPTVVFNTVNAIVQLKNSLGSFIDQGTVQYYFSSWKTLGSTTNGVATKELLPGNYTFRMSYETVTNDKVQDISTNSTVSFFTVLCTVRVKNSQSQPVDGALISYYFSSWRQIGTTVNGEVMKELLPANLTFRMNLGTTQQDKAQNLATNALVEFGVQ